MPSLLTFLLAPSDGRPVERAACVVAWSFVALLTAALFTFVMSWNEVFAATVLTVQNRTLPAQVLVSLREAPDAYKFAGGFFMLIPSVIFIMIIRKYLFNMWGQSSK